jgi:hypothetical protein
LGFVNVFNPGRRCLEEIKKEPFQVTFNGINGESNWFDVSFFEFVVDFCNCSKFCGANWSKVSWKNLEKVLVEPGCEKKQPQESPKYSWKEIFPVDVFASKSGTLSPRKMVMFLLN